MTDRPVVLLTGVGRRRSIATSIALRLAAEGFDLVLSHFRPYDDRVGLQQGADDPAAIAQDCRDLGARVELAGVDLSDPAVPEKLLDQAWRLGPVAGLVMSHCESVDSSITDTTLESWDRHFAVNARASWLLIKQFAARLPQTPTDQVRGRVIALTSDHVAHNLPYGSSKGALDRLVVAAAVELGPRGIRANLINPGPIDTGWMDDQIREAGIRATPAGRLGTGEDIADLVSFLMSAQGGWLNGQLLKANGGFDTHHP